MRSISSFGELDGDLQLLHLTPPTKATQGTQRIT